MKQAEFRGRLDEMQDVAAWARGFPERLNELGGANPKADTWREQFLDGLLPLLGGATLNTPHADKKGACFMASWAGGVLLPKVLGHESVNLPERAEAHHRLKVVTDSDTAWASKNAAQMSEYEAFASGHAARASGHAAMASTYTLGVLKGKEDAIWSSRNAARASTYAAEVLGWKEVGELAVPAAAGLAVLSSPEGDTRSAALEIVEANGEVYRHLAPHLEEAA